MATVRSDLLTPNKKITSKCCNLLMVQVTIRVRSLAVDKKQILRLKRCVFREDLLVTLALLRFFGAQKKENRAIAQIL